MKSWFLHICLFTGCVFSLSSCILDDEIDVNTTETIVELTLSYADDPMSRDVGSKEDELDETTDPQKTLDIEDIYVLAFQAIENNSENPGYDTDKFIGLVDDLTFETTSGVQKLKGRMNPQLFTPGMNVYFAVLTNLKQNNIKDAIGTAVTITTFWNNMKNHTSEAIYENLIYNTSNGRWLQTYDETTKKWVASDTPRIPMWGKTEPRQLSYSSNIDLGDCALYRALAKVQIWIGNKSGITGPDSNKFKITKITVQNANSKGYCVSMNVPNSDINKQYTAPSVPGYAALSNNIVYDDLNVTTAYSDMIYLPEHINTGEGLTPIKILVEYTYNGTEYTGNKAGVIEFYDADGAYDVIRNHSYIFNITAISEQVGHTLLYQVRDWTDVETPDLYFGNSDGNVNNSTVQN